MAIAFKNLKNRYGLDDILTFGRHQGYSVLEILKDRPDYIVWLIQNTDIKFYDSVHQEIERLALNKLKKEVKLWDKIWDGREICDYEEGYFEDIPF